MNEHHPVWVLEAEDDLIYTFLIDFIIQKHNIFTEVRIKVKKNSISLITH